MSLSNEYVMKFTPSEGDCELDTCSEPAIVSVALFADDGLEEPPLLVCGPHAVVGGIGTVLGLVQEIVEG